MFAFVEAIHVGALKVFAALIVYGLGVLTLGTIFKYMKKKPENKKSTLDVAIRNLMSSAIIHGAFLVCCLAISAFFESIPQWFATIFSVISHLINGYFNSAWLIVNCVTIGFLKFVGVMDQITDQKMSKFCLLTSSIFAVVTFLFDHFLWYQNKHSIVFVLLKEASLIDNIGLCSGLNRVLLVVTLVIILVLKVTMADDPNAETKRTAVLVVSIAMIFLGMIHFHLLVPEANEILATEINTIFLIAMVGLVIPFIFILRNDNLKQFVLDQWKGMFCPCLKRPHFSKEPKRQNEIQMEEGNDGNQEVICPETSQAISVEDIELAPEVREESPRRNFPQILSVSTLPQIE